MLTYKTGLDVSILVLVFIYLLILCIGEALSNLCICTGWPATSLLDKAICLKSLCADTNVGMNVKY